jgi:DNA invertase Pin-like site-specific DNA recombinase
MIAARSTGYGDRLGALAEFERDLIRERTPAELIAARTRGYRGGHPRVMGTRTLVLTESL